MSAYSIQQIFQEHGEEFLANNPLPLHYHKVISQLSSCRTSALGGHAQYCENNHLNGVWYNSCKHRFCPQCRGMPTEEWLINTKSILLDSPHHHIIFTIPSELNPLWQYNETLMKDILFKAAHETLKQFAKDPRYLGAIPGMLSVLHTWGRSLSLHPHLHVLLSHGGLDKAGEWKTPKKKILYPQKPIMIVYRGKYLALLKKALTQDTWRYPPDTGEVKTINLANKLGRQDWVVHFCQRYDYAEGVVKYLSRYVKSGPLKNEQLIAVTNDSVTYRYQSHQTKKTETLTLPMTQFIRRLIQHTPASGKPTVRYSGLYSSGARKKLNIAREKRGQLEVSERTHLRWQAFMTEKGDMPVCEICGLPLTRETPIKPLRQVA